MSCPSLQTCPFFNDKMAGMPAASELLKQRYCQSHHTTCARFMVKESGGAAPLSLFPNQTQKAQEIIAAGKTTKSC